MPDRTTRIEISDSVVEKLKIGQQVTVRLRGEIVELEAGREIEFSDETERFPPEMMIKVTSTQVNATDNQFTELLANDEED